MRARASTLRLDYFHGFHQESPLTKLLRLRTPPNAAEAGADSLLQLDRVRLRETAVLLLASGECRQVCSDAIYTALDVMSLSFTSLCSGAKRYTAEAQ